MQKRSLVTRSQYLIGWKELDIALFIGEIFKNLNNLNI